jgi:hypothetical protein
VEESDGVTEGLKIGGYVSNGVGIAAAVAISVVNLSSPATIFSILNQLQLTMLLTLTGAYLDPMVKIFFAGNRAFQFSFSFIPFKEIPFYRYPSKELDFPQRSDSYLFLVCFLEVRSPTFSPCFLQL